MRIIKMPPIFYQMNSQIEMHLNCGISRIKKFVESKYMLSQIIAYLENEKRYSKTLQR